MKSIYYNKNIQRSKLFANQTIASISQCCGGEWYVCIDKYKGMDAVNEYGDLPNPIQTTKTFSTENDAVAFANTFNPTKLKIERPDPNAKPWYEDETKYRFAFD